MTFMIGFWHHLTHLTFSFKHFETDNVGILRNIPNIVGLDVENTLIVLDTLAETKTLLPIPDLTFIKICLSNAQMGPNFYEDFYEKRLLKAYSKQFTAFAMDKKLQVCGKLELKFF